MFVALRDLRHARGRFALVSVVVVLVTFLVTFLASLTAGLARESTSAITDLPVDHVALSVPDGAAVDFTASQVDGSDVAAWADQDGVSDAEPLGIATTRATLDGATGGTSVTVLGVQPGSGLVPDAADVADGEVVLSAGAADDLGAQAGDTLVVAGQDLEVAQVVTDDASYAHTPVVWTTLDDWQAVGAPAGRGADAAGGDVATAVALSDDLDGDALAAAADATGTTVLTPRDARSAVGSFAAENGSLTTMQAFLLAISALVVGAFFTVWTVGRSGDVAVLKALGASTRYLLRDAIGQAVVVLLGGVTLGALLAAGAAALLPAAVPVVVSVATTVLPAALLVVLGVAGAGLAVARITRVDPHAALAAR
ncbi:FtsX-like permease family protein [Isoptericola sp. NPDC057653]|uniref:FtsX-like permease family protein n=1 Tax=Isoptericola sp. NPDC057653 TaxID=3346195 RepID=UPI003681EB3F